MKKTLAILLLVLSFLIVSSFAEAHIEICEAGIDVAAKLMLSVRSEKATDAFVFMASYDESGKLTAVSNEGVTLQEGYNIVNTALNIGDKNATVKLYLWKNNDLAPMTEIKTISFQNGSLPFGEETIMQLVRQMTNEEKAQLVTGRDMPDSKVNGSAGGTRAISRLNIPMITLADGPAGVRIDPNGGATYGVAYPNGTNLASTWDKPMIELVGAAIGRDTAAYGIDVILGPGMNIHRDPLGGRNFEYFSEDPFLTGHIAAAYVKGVQSEGIAACIKHFAANNQETARGEVSANMTERALREIYLTGYEIAIREANPWTVMTTYNRLNGIYNSVNTDLVTGILRDEWGYNGAVFSDWDASGGKAEMVKAQNDFNAPGHDANVSTVLAAINNGTITEGEINQSCANILRLMLRSKVYNNPSYNNRVDFAREEQISRMAAADSMVLLKNDNNTLPIRSGELAVFGNAQVHTQHSGMGAGDVNARHSISIITGLSSRFSINSDVYNKYKNCARNPVGILEDENPANDEQELSVSLAEAEAAAARSQYAVVTITRNTREGKDHRSGIGDFLLNDKERTMIKNVSTAFHNAGKKVIAVLNVGNPIEVASWRNYCDAIILMGYAGQEGGYALADIMAGSISPSAKLTQTFPKKYSDTPTYGNYPMGQNADHIEDIYVGYRYYETFDVEPAYEFGFGLSYTTFTYDNFKLDSDVFNKEVTVTFDITNTGGASGREVAQVYLKKPDGRMEQPALALSGFSKTQLLAPGQKETISIKLTRNEFRTYDTEEAAWVIEPGEYKICVGASVKDIKATLPIVVKSEQTVQRVMNRCEPTAPIDVLTKDNYHDKFKGKAINLAFKKPVTASATEGKHHASFAVDGDNTSRWSAFIGATSATEHTLIVDLEKEYNIGGFKLNWEAINVRYSISVATSPDGPWTKVVQQDVIGILNAEYEVSGISARYVKLAVGVHHYASIFEFEVYEEYTPGETNLAGGKIARADAEEDMHFSENAIDGSFETRWSGYIGTVPEPTHHWTLDLGKVYAIDRIELHWEAIGADYTMQYAENIDGPWTDFYAGKAGVNTAKLDSLGISARYLRVVTASNTWGSLYEFMVFEPPIPGVHNIARGKAAKSDTTEENYIAANAVDGNPATRWSPGVDNTSEAYHWLLLDLGKEYNIDKLHILWEQINAPYMIDIGKEDGTWTRIEDSGKAKDLDVGYAGLNACGRYIKIFVQPNNWASIYELEVYEATESYPVNVSAYKPITATHSQSGYAVANLNDGDLSTRWSATDSSEKEQSAVIDLGQVYRLDSVCMLTEELLGGYEIHVATEADGPWKELTSSTKEAKFAYIRVDMSEFEVFARFIKLVLKDTSKYASVYELMAFGYPAEGENATQNISLGKAVTTNAEEQTYEGVLHAAAHAVDGNLTTRWSGIGTPNDGSNKRSITIDLNDVTDLSEIHILFESVPAGYVIELSEDGNTWTTALEEDPCFTKGLELHKSLKGFRGRYVKISLNPGNYTSIYEVMIY